MGKEWYLQTRVDFSIGWLGDSDNDAAIGTAGPSVVLGRESLPVSLEGGVSPTGLSRSEFGSKDFGTEIQFTSHVGLNWDFASALATQLSVPTHVQCRLGFEEPGVEHEYVRLELRVLSGASGKRGESQVPAESEAGGLEEPRVHP